jgi:hypothetical protein
MARRIFQLSGGDGGAYGPIFGPVTGAEIEATGSRSYLVLQLTEPIKEGDMEIEYLLVAPRYSGDTIETLKERGCTVGVSIVFPEKINDLLQNGSSSKNARYWAIGECRRIFA